MGLEVVHHQDEDLIRAAELIEVSRDNPWHLGSTSSTLSLGDALVLAVTERLGCPVLTRDHYWKWLVENGQLDLHVIIP